MNDLIERLRDERKLGNRPVTKGRLIAEAADEIERLTADRDEWVRLWKNASNGVLSLQARVEALEGAIRWALGESPEGMPEFPLIGEPPYYRWRTQLRLLADLPYIAATEQGESDD